MASNMSKQGAPAPMTFSTYMTSVSVKRKVNDMLGVEAGTRFISSIISAVSVNPALAQCEFGTILSAALLGESLKLSPSPNLGHFYIVPFKQKAKYDRNNNLISPERTVATFQLGYKGYIQLAIRSGQYKKLNVIAIKEGELVNFDPLNEEIEVNLIADEVQRESAKTIGYYAMFEYTNGFRKAMYWSKGKMIAHADRYSKAFDAEKFSDLLAGRIPQRDLWKYSSFWYNDFDAMAYKTMLRQLISKWGIMSIDLQSAMNSDMAATFGDGSMIRMDGNDSASLMPPPNADYAAPALGDGSGIVTEEIPADQPESVPVAAQSADTPQNGTVKLSEL